MAHIDPVNGTESKGAAQVFKDGHVGLLNTDSEAPADNLTTVRVTYQPPQYPGVATKGAKHRLMETAFAQIAA